MRFCICLQCLRVCTLETQNHSNHSETLCDVGCGADRYDDVIEGGACGGVERVEAASLLDDVALVAGLQARLPYAATLYKVPKTTFQNIKGADDYMYLSD